MTRLDTEKQRIVENWQGLLWNFMKSESLSVIIGFAFGVIAAGLLHLVILDRSFQAFVGSKYQPTIKIFDDPRRYFPYVIAAGTVGLIAIAFRLPNFVRRFVRSWWTGVTSAVAVLSFSLTVIGFALNSPSIRKRIIGASALLIIFFSISFWRYLKLKINAEIPPLEDDLRVSSRTRADLIMQWSESDDPIRTWDEDALGRASLVDSITVKLMISRTPVLAVFGELGSGKTSTLNLLREHLENKAIVVSFSTWLPGSQETFTTYLLSDIVNECQKHYVVPGLRKSAQRLVKALGQNVPFIRSYLELLPATTQREDIESLHASLMRLPKRVIVLLDELDRMEKEELLALLKVIRGISHLPNLSFVCAGDFRRIVSTVKGEFNEENTTYFEKFFFDVIDMPELDPAALRKAGSDRLISTLRRRNWFTGAAEEDRYRNQLGQIWEKQIAPFCRNLRAISLLANAVGSASAPLIREVHALDLTLIEMLKRFRPAVYKLVAKNFVVLTGGAGLLRGGTYYSNKEKEAQAKHLLADLQEAVSPVDLETIKAILTELFPRFRKIDDPLRRDTEGLDDEDQKRIRHPEIFPAYFRYELPEAIFPSVEMDAFLTKIENDATRQEVVHTFQEMLDSMEKGSLKRDDFLRKLAQAAMKSLKIQIAINVVHAAMRTAHKLTYDMMAAFGEAGHILRLVLRTAERLPTVAERITLLQGCILDATDDTMALNILTRLTDSENDSNLQVSRAEIHSSFINRMRKRYGRDMDAGNIDLSTSDPFAFNYWGFPDDKEIARDPEDRAIQQDFWLRHIGNSRSRLAQDFRGFFMPASVSYQSDVAPFVENKIPLADLKRLFEQLPIDRDLTTVDRQALRTLERLLNGDFRNGTGIAPYHYPEDETGQNPS